MLAGTTPTHAGDKAVAAHEHVDRVLAMPHDALNSAEEHVVEPSKDCTRLVR
jgi:hypothetical protein